MEERAILIKRGDYKIRAQFVPGNQGQDAHISLLRILGLLNNLGGKNGNSMATVSRINQEQYRLYHEYKALLKNAKIQKFEYNSLNDVKLLMDNLSRTESFADEYKSQRVMREGKLLASLSRIEIWMDSVREVLLRIPVGMKSWVMHNANIPILPAKLFFTSTITGTVFDMIGSRFNCPFCEKITTSSKIYCSNCFFLLPIKLRSDLLKLHVIASRLTEVDLNGDVEIVEIHKLLTPAEFLTLLDNEHKNQLVSYINFCSKQDILSLIPAEVHSLFEKNYLNPQYNYSRALSFLALARAARLGKDKKELHSISDVLLTMYELYYSDFSAYHLPVILGYPLTTTAIYDESGAIEMPYGVETENKFREQFEVTYEEIQKSMLNRFVNPVLIMQRYVEIDRLLHAVDQADYLLGNDDSYMSIFEYAKGSALDSVIINVLQLIAGQIIGYSLENQKNVRDFNGSYVLRHLRLPKKTDAPPFHERLYKAAAIGVSFDVFTSLNQIGRELMTVTLPYNSILHEHICMLAIILSRFGMMNHRPLFGCQSTLTQYNNHYITWVSFNGPACSFQCYIIQDIEEQEIVWLSKIALINLKLTKRDGLLFLEYSSNGEPYSQDFSPTNIPSTATLGIVFVDTVGLRMYGCLIPGSCKELTIIEGNMSDFSACINLIKTAYSVSSTGDECVRSINDYTVSFIAARHCILGPYLRIWNLGNLSKTTLSMSQPIAESVIDEHLGYYVNSLGFFEKTVSGTWKYPDKGNVYLASEPIFLEPVNDDFKLSKADAILAIYPQFIASFVRAFVCAFYTGLSVSDIAKLLQATLSEEKNAKIIEVLKSRSQRMLLDSKADVINDYKQQLLERCREHYKNFQKPRTDMTFKTKRSTLSLPILLGEVPTTESEKTEHLEILELTKSELEAEDLLKRQYFQQLKNGVYLEDIDGWAIIDKKKGLVPEYATRRALVITERDYELYN